MQKSIGKPLDIINKDKNNYHIHSDINIIVSDENGKPIIELRKKTNDSELIKKVIMAAFLQKPLIIQPTFTNRIKSINTLMNKGIIYNDNGKLYFTF